MKIIFVVAVFLFVNGLIEAQSIMWQKTYGDSGEDEGFSVIQTFDGGYIMSGMNQFSQTTVIKTNQFGEIIWNKSYEGNVYDNIIQTKDSNFILVGFAQGINGIYSDGYIIKINQEGDLIWWKKYGGNYSDYFHDALVTYDDKFIIVGTYTSENFSDVRNMYLLKADSAGNEIWNRIYDSTGSGFNIDEIQGKGYLLSGTTEIYVDYNGNSKYSGRALGINGLNALNNHGFIYFDNKDTNGINAIRIIRTDSMFNELSRSWIYKPDRLLFGKKIIKDVNSYIIGGENISFQGDEDAYIVKIDTAGIVVWDSNIPSRFKYNESINSIYKCSDSGFIAIGFSSPFSGNTDFLAIKTDKYGNTIPVSIENISTVKTDDFNLFQNYPNPFNPVTHFEFGIPASQGESDLGFVSLKVYDILGKEVAVLVNKKLSPGRYKAEFNGHNFASGVYFYRLVVSHSNPLESESFMQTKRMVLLK